MFAVDPDSVPDSVKAACGDNRECLFDFAQTQDMDFAMSTMSEVEDQEDLRRILSEWPHCFFCCYNLHGFSLLLVYFQCICEWTIEFLNFVALISIIDLAIKYWYTI